MPYKPSSGAAGVGNVVVVVAMGTEFPQATADKKLSNSSADIVSLVVNGISNFSSGRSSSRLINDVLSRSTTSCDTKKRST